MHNRSTGIGELKARCQGLVTEVCRSALEAEHIKGPASRAKAAHSYIFAATHPSLDMQFTAKFTTLACGVLVALTSAVTASPTSEVSLSSPYIALHHSAC